MAQTPPSNVPTVDVGTPPRSSADALPAIAHVLDGLAGPMERAQMIEPAAALRRGAEHARDLHGAVTAAAIAGKTLLTAIGALLPAPRPRRTARTARVSVKR